MGVGEYLKQISTINIAQIIPMDEANWGNMASNIDKMRSSVKREFFML